LGLTTIIREIKILLVDDNRKVRGRLRALLDQEEDIQVVGEAKNGLDAIKIAENLYPNLILMDVKMPEMGGIEATHTLKKLYPKIPVILLSVYENHELAERGAEAGASAYLVKDSPVEQLIKTIKKYHRSEN